MAQPQLACTDPAALTRVANPPPSVVDAPWHVSTTIRSPTDSDGCADSADCALVAERAR